MSRSIVDDRYRIRIILDGNNFKSPPKVNPNHLTALHTHTKTATTISKSDVYLWEPETPRWCSSCNLGDPDNRTCGHLGVRYLYLVTCDVYVKDTTTDQSVQVHGVSLTTTVKCKCSGPCTTHNDTPMGLGYVYRYTIL